MAWAPSSFGDLNSATIPKRNVQHYSNTNNQGSTQWNRNQQSTSTGKTQPWNRNQQSISTGKTQPWNGNQQSTSTGKTQPLNRNQQSTSTGKNQTYHMNPRGDNNALYPRQGPTQQQKNSTGHVPDKNSVSKLETLMAGYSAVTCIAIS